MATQGQDKSGASAEGRADGSWSVGELLSWTTQKLRDLGIAEARVDAEHLLAHALGCRRLDLYLQHARLLDGPARAGFRDLVKRRLAREPVAYIEGRRGFHALNLDLAIDRRVLIPRPDTEHLVDWLLDELPLATPSRTLNVLDIGTGSGAIALAIKHARADLQVLAVDRSPEALAVAQANAKRLALDLRFGLADLVDGVTHPAGGWAAVAANLPYIPSAEVQALAPEVRDYEPHLALDGGADGLDLIARLIRYPAWDQWLRPGGFLILEFGIHQAPAIVKLLQTQGWIDIQVRRDYAGIERVVLARRTLQPADERRVIDDATDTARAQSATGIDGIDGNDVVANDDALSQENELVEWIVVPDPEPNQGLCDDDES